MLVFKSLASKAQAVILRNILSSHMVRWQFGWQFPSLIRPCLGQAQAQYRKRTAKRRASVRAVSNILMRQSEYLVQWMPFAFAVIVLVTTMLMGVGP